MDITFLGTNSGFFGEAFFDNNGTFNSTNLVSESATEIVFENTSTGVLTTVAGFGFSVDANGVATGGTITSLSFVQGGVTQATVTGITWGLGAFSDSLNVIEEFGNEAPLAALFSSDGPITIDASNAAGPYVMSDFETIADLFTQPVTLTGSGNSGDFLVGGRGNDTILLGASEFGADYLVGSAGNDTINFSGMGPNSYVNLDYSLDFVAGAANSPVTFNINEAANTGSITAAGFTDTLVDVSNGMVWGVGFLGGNGNDTYNVTSGNGWFNLQGGEGADNYTINVGALGRISFGAHSESSPFTGVEINIGTGVIANDGYGNTEQISVTGTGTLEVRGTNLNDIMTGGAGDERFITEQGDDTIDGGDGFDMVRYDRGNITGLVVDLSNLSAIGFWDAASFADTLTNIEAVRGSQTGNDTITGDDVGNHLDGRGGNDFIDGGGGDDTILGGTGNDTVRGSDGTDTVVIDGNFAEVSVSVQSGAIVISGVHGNTRILDDVELIAFNDQVLAYDDFLPSEPPQTLVGTGEPDVVEGGTGDDTITGRAGSDELSGGGGADSIVGGIGFDSIYGGTGNDTLQGQDGFDDMYGGEGDDVLIGNNGFDLLEGQGGNDTLIGGLGLDTMRGGEGEDVLLGQSGFDVLEGGNGADDLSGNAGADTISGDGGDDVLNGGINNDVLNGGEGVDTLNGNNGADMLFGDAGDDRLEGNAGSDTLDGGTGNDVMRGGIGADTFVFAVGSGDDRIADFQNNIDTFHLDAALLTETNPEFEDLRNYASLNADGFVVLTFGADSLTFTGITNTTALLDDIAFI